MSKTEALKVNNNQKGDKTVKLTPLAITELGYRYARKMDDNKIRHYKSSMALDIIESIDYSLSDSKSKALPVIKFIKSQEGEDVNVEIMPDLLSSRNIDTSKGVIINDATKEVLGNDPEIEKAIRKAKFNKFEIKVEKYNSIFDRILDFVQDSFYSLASRWKNRNKSKCWPTNEEFETMSSEKFMKEFIYESLNPAPKRRMVKYNNKCCEISYQYREGKEAEAFQRLRNDLKVLNDKNLILGHLVMPSTIVLADTEGSGELKKSVFCYIFVDRYKLSKILNIKLADICYGTPLTKLGISESAFGEVGTFIEENKYQIEEVQVTLGDKSLQDLVNEAYLESYNDYQQHSKDMANKIKMSKNKNKT